MSLSNKSGTFNGEGLNSENDQVTHSDGLTMRKLVHAERLRRVQCRRSQQEGGLLLGHMGQLPKRRRQVHPRGHRRQLVHPSDLQLCRVKPEHVYDYVVGPVAGSGILISLNLILLNQVILEIVTDLLLLFHFRVKI